MIWKKYLGEFKNLELRFKVLLFTNICLTVALVTLAGMTVSMATSKRTIIVPSQLAAQVEVSDGASDPTYIRVMSIHLAELLFDYTPYNIVERYNEFLHFVPVDALPTFKETMNVRIAQVEQTKVAESFNIEELHYKDAHTVIMSGKVVRYASGQQIGDEEMYLELGYKIRNGGFNVTNLKNLSQEEYRRVVRVLRADESGGNKPSGKRG